MGVVLVFVVVGAEGIEPVIGRLKASCSAIELRPRIGMQLVFPSSVHGLLLGCKTHLSCCTLKARVQWALRESNSIAEWHRVYSARTVPAAYSEPL